MPQSTLTGPRGSVIAQVSSSEEKGDLVIDSRVANEGDGWAGSGAHPWHLDDETESILFLTNADDKECPIGFRVQAEGVLYYLTDLKLAPHETKSIDIRKLRDAQKPDFLGSTIRLRRDRIHPKERGCMRHPLGAECAGKPELKVLQVSHCADCYRPSSSF